MQIIELYIKGFNIIRGSVKSLATNKLIDTNLNFNDLGVIVGDLVTNQRTQETAQVTAIDSDTQLSISDDIFVSPNYDVYRIESNYFRADLFEDESVTITDSLLNVKDIGKVFTPFSQQFNLPASKLNNKLFRHYENFDVENSFDARFRHDAIIKLNGIDYKKGQIQFKSVSLKDNKPYAYKVVFYGDAVALKEVLGETKLSGLIYPSSLNFDYTQVNIENFFTASDSAITTAYGSTDVLVPNIHHSKNMRYTNAGYKDNITGTGLEWVDLKPALRCRTIIEAINNTYPQINLTGFFNSTSFSDVYMWLHRNEGYVSNAEEGGGTNIVRNRWRHQTDDPLEYTHTGTTPAAYGDVRTLPINSAQIGNAFRFRYRPVVNVYTSDPTPYTVRIIKGNTGYVYHEFNHSSGGNSITYVDIDYNTSGQSAFLDLIIEIEAESNITMTHTLAVQTWVKQGFGSTYNLLFSANYSPAANEPDNTFYIGKQMPDMKVMDFLSGLFKMFNLVVFKDGDNIDVQRAAWYMNLGNSYDITKYVDTASSSVERIFQYKRMDFKFKSKKSFLVQYSDEIQGIPFAEEDYGDNEWDGGVYEIQLPFEKMMYERLNNEDTGAQTLIGQGAMLDKKFESTIGDPLLFCMTYQANTNSELEIGGIAPSNYRRPTNLTSFNWGFDTRLQLNFGLEADEWEGTIPSQSTNLFEAGYLDYVETVFDRRSRLYKVSAYLPLSLITKYKLNDKFIINNTSFRINSIKTNLLTNKTDLELYNKDEYVSQAENNQVSFVQRVTELQETATTTGSVTFSFLGGAEPDAFDVHINGGYYSTVTSIGIPAVYGVTATGLESGRTYNISVRAKYIISGVDVFSFDEGITSTTK